MFEKISDEQLNRIQFYLSKRITLTESMPGAVNVNDSGVIIITEEAVLKEVTIRSETAGVLSGCKPIDGRMTLIIGFDEDNKRSELRFIENRERERFELMMAIDDGLPKTSYGDAIYEISYQGPGIPHLLVITEQRATNQREARVVRGRYIIDMEDEAVPEEEYTRKSLSGRRLTD
ncbi:MAG: hypothetical protein LBU28_10515 [Spirochaetaceae bacterium]|jgi:hypothetical protein|nr:hypothetical protein [Spirochaetaceae bacterium]